MKHNISAMHGRKIQRNHFSAEVTSIKVHTQLYKSNVISKLQFQGWKFSPEGLFKCQPYLPKFTVFFSSLLIKISSNKLFYCLWNWRSTFSISQHRDCKTHLCQLINIRAYIKCIPWAPPGIQCDCFCRRALQPSVIWQFLSWCTRRRPYC